MDKKDGPILVLAQPHIGKEMLSSLEPHLSMCFKKYQIIMINMSKTGVSALKL